MARTRLITRFLAPSGRAALVAAVAVLALPLTALADPPSSSDPGDWVTDGPVYAIAHADGRTFIGGEFSHVGPRTGPGLPLGADGHPVAPYPEVAGGEVRAAIPDGGGGWYIGGDFTSVGGLSRNRIAHITPGGGVDIGFNPGANGTVRALSLGSSDADANVLYLGGSFTNVGGQSRTYLAAVDRTTGATQKWSPNPDDVVYAVAARPITIDVKLTPDATAYTPKSMSVVFAGGDFGSIGTTPFKVTKVATVWGVGAVDRTNAADAGAVLSGGSSGLNWASFSQGPVRAMAVTPGQAVANCSTASKPARAWVVYTGSNLSVTTRLIATQLRIDTQGSTAGNGGTCNTYSAPAVNGEIDALALSPDGSTFYLGGDFTQVGAAAPAHTRLAAVDAWTALNTSASAPAVRAWAPAADAPVNSLAVSPDGSAIYAGGKFAGVGVTPVARPGLAAIDASSGEATGWDPQPAGGPAYVVATNGSDVYAGGGFTAIGAVPRSNLAAVDASGALDPNWNPGTDASVRALAVSGDTLYVGGAFATLSGKPRNHLGALGLADGAATPWDPDLDGWALALSVRGPTVYAGGSFTHVGHAPRNMIAAIDGGSGAATAWDPSSDDVVRAITASCDNVYVGGSFTHIGGADRSRIAALSSADGTATTWDPDANSVVYSLVSTGDKLYAGGGFSLIGGAVRRGLAAIDTGTGTSTSWNPTPESPSIVRALALSPDASTAYAGGSFITMGGESRGRLAAVATASGALRDWNPGADLPAYAIAVSGDNVFAGGTFTQVGTVMQQGFATFTAGADADAAPPVVCPGDAPPPAPAPVEPPSGGVLGVKLAADTTAPVLDHLRVTSKRFRVGARATALDARRQAKKQLIPTGTAFVYRLSEAARVTVLIQRAAHPKPRTVRWHSVGRLTRNAILGSNSVAFTGRIGSKALARGEYRVTLVARDAAGNRSRPVRATFEVVR